MAHSDWLTYLPQHPPCLTSTGWVVVAGLLLGGAWTCHDTPLPDLERVQTGNIQLAKAFHNHVNHRDWRAVEQLCAETVRYRGRATHFAEVDEPKARFVSRYRTQAITEKAGSIEIRQIYPAGAHHVIVEGIAPAESPGLPLLVCLIYTIEHRHVTRLHAY